MIRLYVTGDLSPGAAVAPTLDQSRYLTQVMRLKAGDELLVFNGRDGEWRGALALRGKKAAAARVLEQTRRQAAEPDLWLCFAPVKRADRYVPGEIYDLFPVLKDMLGRRGGDLSGGQQQQLAIGRALVMRPRLLVLDEPTEGIQPSIIKDIGRVIRRLADEGLDGHPVAILLCEQYYDFAAELADEFLVLERGSVIARGDRAAM